MTVTKTSPVYLGRYSPLVRGNTRALGIGLAKELDDGDTIQSCTITVTDAGDEAVDAVSEVTVSPTTGVSYLFTCPDTPGAYGITAVFALADGQRLTKTAHIEIL